MKSEIESTSGIAACVGLWLAEGDTKTKSEITFTNNCFQLIEFFANTVQQIFNDYSINPRIYIYSAKKEKYNYLPYCKTNHYIDKRAKKPYYIFRIASVDVLKRWTKLVEDAKHDKTLYASILQGFFAGEGNLKEGSHFNRGIRIAQGKTNKFIEQILKYYDIKYRFSYAERAYTITGKWNWDKLAVIKIADLHPIKKEKFWRIFNSFKEIHYPDYFLRDNIYKILDKPYTSLELSKIFNRSQARVQDILTSLKKKGELRVFKVKSKSYWIKSNQNTIIISKIKEKYLNLLRKREKGTTEIAKELGVCWKAAYRRLTELHKLNLVAKDSKGVWKYITPNEKVIIL